MPIMAYTSELQEAATCFTDAKQRSLVLLRGGCDYKS